ncbi:hypothetical protein EDC01DRAFT_611535, partial [Geopyxis carbonaria]
VGGQHGRTYVTRKPGIDEKYKNACLVPAYKKIQSVHCHGSISGWNKGPLIFWDPKWGKISSKAYINHIIKPHVHPFWKEYQRTHPGYVYYMHDNASSHTAKNTMKELKELNMQDYLFPWPACSPDMTPIEHV